MAVENHPKPLFLRSLSPAECPPDRYRALLVAGRDAASFLQGQLTQDIGRVEAGQLRLAALLTPQGRVLATPWLTARDGSTLLLLPAALAAPVRDGLQRYVLRAKVALSLAELDAGLAARLGAAVALHRTGPSAAPAASAPAADAGARWALALVEAGHPEIGPATSGEWIPQMLNLDLLDAISTAKGCYTGQEIVARTQNLGRIKRRMFRYATPAATPPEPKAALYAGGQKVGEVVLAAASATGSELLAVVNLDVRDASLVLADGAPCRPVPLPYAVP
jgi:folate-binding protein YgfZ